MIDDLTKQPPRSPKLTLNGITSLPRLFDKVRAANAGRLGDYKLGPESVLDTALLQFLGCKLVDLQEAVKHDPEDRALLQKVMSQGRHPSATEIAEWSETQYRMLAKDDPGRQAYIRTVLEKCGLPAALTTTFDWIDFDDRRSFHLGKQIGVIGAGNVGGSIGSRLARCGHQLVFAFRESNSSKAAELKDRAGTGARVAAVSEIAKSSDVIFLATPWDNTESALATAGPLAEKVVVDCTNPLRYSPATGLQLALGLTESGGEKVAGWSGGGRVIKAFNTYGWENFADTYFPGYGDLRPVMFLCGDDSAAKTIVSSLASDLGFEPFDTGPLSSARFLEPLAMLWISNARKADRGAHFTWATLRSSAAQE
jgi:8-hydroxy-5-deazaflavin:NADPH oxidoreductase